jgi:MOSC domain-containing protein YiiM
MRFGTYFRIVEDGSVEPGSPMTIHAAAPQPTLPSRDVARIYMFAHDEKHKLAEIPALALHWRSWGAGIG